MYTLLRSSRNGSGQISVVSKRKATGQRIDLLVRMPLEAPRLDSVSRIHGTIGEQDTG